MHTTQFANRTEHIDRLIDRQRLGLKALRRGVLRQLAGTKTIDLSRQQVTRGRRGSIRTSAFVTLRML